jgi:hypothetical protein
MLKVVLISSLKLSTLLHPYEAFFIFLINSLLLHIASCSRALITWLRTPKLSSLIAFVRKTVHLLSFPFFSICFVCSVATSNDDATKIVVDFFSSHYFIVTRMFFGEF